MKTEGLILVALASCLHGISKQQSGAEQFLTMSLGLVVGVAGIIHLLLDLHIIN